VFCACTPRRGPRRGGSIAAGECRIHGPALEPVAGQASADEREDREVALGPSALAAERSRLTFEDFDGSQGQRLRQQHAVAGRGRGTVDEVLVRAPVDRPISWSDAVSARFHSSSSP
jgi:hypothetical protein